MLLAVEITMRHVWIALAWIGGILGTVAAAAFLVYLGAAFAIYMIATSFWRR